MTKGLITSDFRSVIEQVHNCTSCTTLPLGPNPILQLNPAAKILIAGQAPGRITHEKSIPFDDPSGDRLRDWLGVTRETFYDDSKIAILPMAFCFPGSGKSGDLPPPTLCAELWREKLLKLLPKIELTLVIGQYAQAWHLADQTAKTLTETVKLWPHFWPRVLPMPHPSPRNNRWLKNNPWFTANVLPKLQARTAKLLG